MDLKKRVPAWIVLGLFWFGLGLPLKAQAQSESDSDCRRNFGATFYQYVEGLAALPIIESKARYRTLRNTVDQLHRYVEAKGIFSSETSDWEKWNLIQVEDLGPLLRLIRGSGIPESLFDLESLAITEDYRNIRRKGLTQQIANYEFLLNRIFLGLARVFEEDPGIAEQRKTVGAYTNLIALQNNFTNQSKRIQRALEDGFTLLGYNSEKGGLVIPPDFGPSELLGKPILVHVEDVIGRPTIQDRYRNQIQSLEKFDQVIEYYNTRQIEGIWEIPQEILPEHLKYLRAQGTPLNVETAKGHRDAIRAIVKTRIRKAGIYSGKLRKILQNAFLIETDLGDRVLFDLNSSEFEIRGIAISLMEEP